MSKIKISLLAIFLPLVARAQELGGKLLEDTAGKAHYQTAGGASDITTVVGNVIAVFLNVLGIIFLLYIIYGGYIWLIARGNEEKVERAISTIRNGIIGLIIVLSAYAISYYVVRELSSRTLSN